MALVVGASAAPTAITSVGFRYAAGQFSDLTLPNSPHLVPSGINDQGDISGTIDAGCFLRRADGTVTMLAIPGATRCVARGVNNAGSVAGFYLSPDGQWGFVSKGPLSVTVLRIINCVSTLADAISNDGAVAGTCNQISAAPSWGFVINPDGKVTPIFPPDAAQVFLNGVNAKGQVIGAYYTATFEHQAFVFSGGTYKDIALPDCVRVEARAINDAGLVVGQCTPAGKAPARTFLLDLGTWSTRYLTPPDGRPLLPYAINNAGDIVGTW